MRRLPALYQYYVLRVLLFCVYICQITVAISASKCVDGSAERALNITVGLATTNKTYMNRMLKVMYDLDISEQIKGKFFPGGREDDGTATCYHIVPSIMEFEDTGFSYVHLEEERSKLFQVNASMFVGAYLSSLEGFTAAYKRLYFVSTPLPFFFEEHEYHGEHHLHRAQASRIISIWPSYYMYARALRLFVDLLLTNELGGQHVLFLTHTASVDGLNFVSLLEREIGEPSYREIYTHDIWREVQQMRQESSTLRRSQQYNAIMTNLRSKLKTNKIQLIVVYFEMELEEKFRALESMFTKGADLEDAAVPWLIADMTLPFMNGAIERLKNLDVLRTRVYLPSVWGSFNFFVKYVLQGRARELLSDGVEGMGVKQIAEVLERVSSKVPPSKLGDQHTFFEALDEFIKMKEVRNSSSLELLGYPRNVIISFSMVAPQTTDHISNFTTTGEVRAVFGRPESLIKIEPPEGLSRTKLKNYTYADYELIGIRPSKQIQPKAVIVLDQPFAHVRPDGTYEGIVIDIFSDIDRILMSEGIFLNLELYNIVGYGRKRGSVWNGALGEIQNDQNTVIALGQFSINEERSQDFAFSTPFGYIGYSFIVKKTEKFNTFLQFTKPFTTEVWICLCAVMLIAACYIYLVDLWNPFKNHFENEFTFKESLWYSYLTISQAGAPFGAYSIPTRTFSVFYWFFALVVVGCYTGNLASFLTESVLEKPSIDLSYLVNSPYGYGYLANSSATEYYSNRLGLDKSASDRGENFRTYEEGIAKARNGSFVLLGTSTVLKWYENNDPECSLSMHESPFYTRGIHEIAFAMDKKWQHADAVNRALQFIRESGRLQRIYHRWVNFAGECHRQSDDGDQVSLALYHTSGLMVLLAVSVAASFLCLAIKLIHLKMRDSAEQDDALGTPTGTECIPLQSTDAGAETKVQEIV